MNEPYSVADETRTQRLHSAVAETRTLDSLDKTPLIDTAAALRSIEGDNVADTLTGDQGILFAEGLTEG